MKYLFTFNEINYGRIEIEADREPDNGEIIEKILEGKADYNNTDFTDFKLIEVDGEAPNRIADGSEGLQEFEVTITETLKRPVEVEARDKHEAEQIISDNWHKSEYILDADNFHGVEFEAAPADKVI
jgi:hypothetical protein